MLHWVEVRTMWWCCCYFTIHSNERRVSYSAYKHKSAVRLIPFLNTVTKWWGKFQCSQKRLCIDNKIFFDISCFCNARLLSGGKCEHTQLYIMWMLGNVIQGKIDMRTDLFIFQFWIHKIYCIVEKKETCIK